MADPFVTYQFPASGFILNPEGQTNFDDLVTYIRDRNDGTEDWDSLSVDSPTLVVDSTNHRVGMGTASPSSEVEIVGLTTMGATSGTRSLVIDSDLSNNFEIVSGFAGTAHGGGRIGPAGPIVNWSPSGNSANGDYIVIINAEFKDSAGTAQEYAEIGTVLVNRTAGSDTSRMVFNIRGNGRTFLTGGSHFSIDPISDDGAILRWGLGAGITDTAPSTGGGYAWSEGNETCAFSAGAQPGATFVITARTADPVVIKMGFGVSGRYQVCTDNGLTPGNTFTPTPRLTILKTGEVGIATESPGTSLDVNGVVTIRPTSNQLVIGTTRTVTITAPTPASSSRTHTIPDITGNGTFAFLEGTQTFSGGKTFSAVAQFADGSAGAPSIAFSTANTNGLYYAGSNAVSLATNGTEKIRVTQGGNFLMQVAGANINIKEGTNAAMGSSTMVAGTVTVNTTKVAATSRIMLTPQNTSGTAGAVYVSARTAGTSFTITSTNAADTRDVAWIIFDPS